MRPRKLDYAKIRELRTFGLTFSAIAKKLNCSPNAVSKSLTKPVVQSIFPHKYASRINHDDAVMMYKDGSTLQDIGEKYGVTRERVRQILAKYNVIMRNNKDYNRERALKRMIQCKYCDKQFEYKNKRQKYCSIACAGRAVTVNHEWIELGKKYLDLGYSFNVAAKKAKTDLGLELNPKTDCWKLSTYAHRSGHKLKPYVRVYCRNCGVEHVADRNDSGKTGFGRYCGTCMETYIKPKRECIDYAIKLIVSTEISATIAIRKAEQYFGLPADTIHVTRVYNTMANRCIKQPANMNYECNRCGKTIRQKRQLNYRKVCDECNKQK